MFYLMLTTLIWALSYNLIGSVLTHQVDSYFAVMTRVVLALLLFIPLMQRIPLKAAGVFAGLGAIQLGLMYSFYYPAYALISVPELLAFTIFTPLYVTLLDDALNKTFHPLALGAVSLGILGAAIIRYTPLNAEYFQGFLLIQAANLLFAMGQVGYKRFLSQHPALNNYPQHAFFGYFYLGATLITVPLWLWRGSPVYPDTFTEWAALGWLGLVASGLGYFLWNKGATQVNPAQLATMNNAVIPVALLINLCFFGEQADLLRLSLGTGLIIISLGLAQKSYLTREVAH